ncbi:MAG: two-component regulator propeller domain-containing protein [Vicingaceae bacterium]
MLNKFIIILALFFQSYTVLSQNIPIGSWRDHLPYSDAISVTQDANTIYCATNSALFTYNKSDFTLERLNLVNGLSDIGLSKVKFNPHNNKLIITYANGNIDVIDENKNVTNLSFIKKSNVTGSKSINHIKLEGKLAYLSTDFGIVVLDTDKLEIVDTYLFGPLGINMITNAVAFDNTNIYAATNDGVYFANKSSTNLSDYNAWSHINSLGSKAYRSIVFFSNRLFLHLDSPNWNEDSLLYNDGGIWQQFISNGFNIESLNVSNNTLIVSGRSLLKAYDSSLNLSKDITTINGWFNTFSRETIMSNDGYFWCADNSHGLVQSKGNYNNNIIHPSGPSSTDAFNMAFYDDELWVVSGGYGSYLPDNRINHKTIDDWEVLDKRFIKPNGSPVLDLVSVAIDPTNKNRVYAGSWSSGLLELNNGKLNKIYNSSNSAIDSTGSITVTGPLQFDEDNNLWVLNSFTTNILAVKTSNNNWFSYDFSDYATLQDEFHDLIIDQNNYKWIVNSETKGLIVFDDNNTLDNVSDDAYVKITNTPGASIECIVEDQDGEIWLGTDKGVAVIYNTASVFNENVVAEHIFLQQDGQTQKLLETEIVTVIKIDGANRKWIGTQNSGVYLMSEDGTEEIEHFTENNSPLFSNTIFDIVIDPKTGEIYFGTEKGILSYRGTATDADTDFDDVFVFPNPVKPDFTGTIGIRGLVKDTDVRITDISGNIVYQTTSFGGQAVWDGKDFNGNKVQTGVYIVFNGSPEGELKAVAKILFIH